MARTEGYFRLEWRLADQRTHLMAKGRAFRLPVVIDHTRDADAHVPDSFSEAQWTRLPDGETSAAFCARVKKLLGAKAMLLAFTGQTGAAKKARKLTSKLAGPATESAAAEEAIRTFEVGRSLTHTHGLESGHPDHRLAIAFFAISCELHSPG